MRLEEEARAAAEAERLRLEEEERKRKEAEVRRETLQAQRKLAVNADSDYRRMLLVDSAVKAANSLLRGSRVPADKLRSAVEADVGIRVFMATPGRGPREVRSGRGRRGHWSRRHLATWLAELLADDVPTIVGLDHGFSFPMAYFEQWGIPLDWPSFLDDFHAHWPTDGADVRVEHVRQGICGQRAARHGNARWRRLADRVARAKSVFHFDVPGSVAKSTCAGLPWLRYLRHELGQGVHFWPFDGWVVPEGRSVIAEMYPSLRRMRCPTSKEPRTNPGLTEMRSVFPSISSSTRVITASTSIVFIHLVYQIFIEAPQGYR